MSSAQKHSTVFISRTVSVVHIIERIGLAMVGIACGLYVAALIAQIEDGQFASFTLFALAMGGGAAGFYSKIDIPPHTTTPETLDPTELLGAVGTFLAALAALSSLYMIVGDVRPSLELTMIDGACWLLGVIMQVLSGFLARLQSA